MLEKLAKLREEVLSKIDGSKNIEELNELKVKILGKKGEFTTIMKGMSEISAEKRAEFGKTTNEIKSLLNERFENKLTELKELAKEKVLTDKFASTNISQARALSEILNESFKTNTDNNELNGIQLDLFEKVEQTLKKERISTDLNNYTE